VEQKQNYIPYYYSKVNNIHHKENSMCNSVCVYNEDVVVGKGSYGRESS